MDVSLVSGEHAPVSVAAGSVVRAGTFNETGPLTIVATATAGDSFLGEMMRMIPAAEQGRSGYRRIADRAASVYAPVVHLTALMTFAGWLFMTADVHRALTIAIAVLIITCPCALGLAVPMVQVVAARRLFEARHHGERRWCAGAPRRSRHDRLRQDRNTDRSAAPVWLKCAMPAARRRPSRLGWLRIPGIHIRVRCWSLPRPCRLQYHVRRDIRASWIRA